MAKNGNGTIWRLCDRAMKLRGFVSCVRVIVIVTAMDIKYTGRDEVGDDYI